MLPTGPGLDGLKRNFNRESKYDIGFQIINLGVSYNFGKNKVVWNGLIMLMLCLQKSIMSKKKSQV